MMSLEERINQYYDLFTANDRYICECILNHKQDCIHLSIDDFAYKYHISTSTLSRFAQKLKLPGYSELRTILRLNQNTLENPSHNIDDMLDCYKKVVDYIDQKDCSVMFERIRQANRIIIFGEGYSQGRIAKEMKRIFLPTGKRIYDVYGFDTKDSLISFTKTSDVVIFISFRGESKQMIDFARKIKMKGIYTVSITNLTSNSLSQLCDDNLYIHSMEIKMDHDVKYEITTPYFILVELLYIKYKMYWKEMNILP